jgi:hypothetical protein
MDMATDGEQNAWDEGEVIEEITLPDMGELDDEMKALRDQVIAPTCAFLDIPTGEFDPLSVKLNADVRKKISVVLSNIPNLLYLPTLFTPPLRGSRTKSLQDIFLYKHLNDMRSLYKSIFAAIFEIRRNDMVRAEVLLAEAAMPLVTHCMSAVNLERASLRHSREVVKELSESFLEPILRPSQIQRAMKLSKEKESVNKLEEIFQKGNRPDSRKTRGTGSQFRGPLKSRRFRRRGYRPPPFNQNYGKNTPHFTPKAKKQSTGSQ